MAAPRAVVAGMVAVRCRPAGTSADRLDLEQPRDGHYAALALSGGVSSDLDSASLALAWEAAYCLAACEGPAKRLSGAIRVEGALILWPSVKSRKTQNLWKQW